MRKGHEYRSLSSVLAVVLLLSLGGCSKDSNPTDTNPPQGRTAISIPLENALKGVVIPANTPTRVVVTLHTPIDNGVMTAASIDIASTIKHINVAAQSVPGVLRQLVASLFSPQATAQATVRVGTDPATVCDQSLVYGPYTISTESIGQPSPDSIELNSPTIQILNNGYAVLCVEITTSVDVTFDLNQLEAKVARQNCVLPSDFAGTWIGTYGCGNSCASPFGGEVALTITQNGSSAQYIDRGGDHYTGSICGNKFRFERVDVDEIERGTMTLIDANHAIKHSTWRGRIYPYCWGDCTDTLTR